MPFAKIGVRITPGSIAVTLMPNLSGQSFGHRVCGELRRRVRAVPGGRDSPGQ
jgi:hypothetical protein